MAAKRSRLVCLACREPATIRCNDCPQFISCKNCWDEHLLVFAEHHGSPISKYARFCNDSQETEEISLSSPPSPLQIDQPQTTRNTLSRTNPNLDVGRNACPHYRPGKMVSVCLTHHELLCESCTATHKSTQKHTFALTRLLNVESVQRSLGDIRKEEAAVPATIKRLQDRVDRLDQFTSEAIKEVDRVRRALIHQIESRMDSHLAEIRKFAADQSRILVSRCTELDNLLSVLRPILSRSFDNISPSTGLEEAGANWIVLDKAYIQLRDALAKESQDVDPSVKFVPSDSSQLESVSKACGAVVTTSANMISPISQISIVASIPAFEPPAPPAHPATTATTEDKSWRSALLRRSQVLTPGLLSVLLAMLPCDSGQELSLLHSSRQGHSPHHFHKAVSGQHQIVVILKHKRTQAVFGGYVADKFVATSRTSSGWVTGNAANFVFRLDGPSPIKLLRSFKGANTFNLNTSSVGFVMGPGTQGNDLSAFRDEVGSGHCFPSTFTKSAANYSKPKPFVAGSLAGLSEGAFEWVGTDVLAEIFKFHEHEQ